MKDYSPRSESQEDAFSIGEDGRASLERREKRRQSRSKNSVIWSELALIGALCVVLLAFNLKLNTPASDRDVSARTPDDIRLRNVRVTPPEPEPPQPEPQRRRKPVPEVPKEMPRTEVPDEKFVETPEMTDEPVLQELETAPVDPTFEAPAPRRSLDLAPEADRVFQQGTADQNARMKGGIEVDYPPVAKRVGIEGRVILQFVVDESGRAQDIQVLRSPHDALAEAAVAALKKKSFEPAMQGGRPVKMRMSQPITFRLR